MVLSMTPLPSLSYSDQNEVKNNFFSHLIPTAPQLLSCDANCIISGTFCSSGEDMKQGMTLLFWSCDVAGTSVSITWHWWHCKGANLFARSRWSNKVQHDIYDHVMSVLASHDTDCSIKSTIALLFQDGKNEMQHVFFFSHLTLGNDINMWLTMLHWYSTIVFIRSRHLKYCAM